MNIDEVLQTFIIEANELLEQMEEALLRIEQMPQDADTINAIFRAAHTIKGSAGLFGLDHVVGFTHVAENVLDKVRSGQVHFDADLVALFLAVNDQLAEMIKRIAEGRPSDADLDARSDELARRLSAYLGQAPHTAATAAASTAAAEPVPACAATSGEACASDAWHISLRFGKDILRNGMDPLSFLRYLGTFGEIVGLVTVDEHLPALSALDAENCYLGFELAFRSDADKATIDGTFDFVRDDAVIHILPPHGKLAEFQQLIEELPEEEMRLGEILVRCGSLTESELSRALAQQEQQVQAEGQRLGDVLVEQKSVQPQVVAAALGKQQQVKERKASEASMIRVNAEKLDEHINLIGELIIASASTSLIAQRSNDPDLNEAAARLSRLVEQVRDSALTLRMVQIGATFNKFQRVVRDISSELGKDIRLEISGADTELDKTVVEKIGDPLTHLVRNSLDHGIESAEVRVAKGKPAQGTIRLNAYHDSGSIVIEVSDDGGGLNKERILQKAIERGLVKPEQMLSDNEIQNLIFEAGFSTATEVSNISGRGVGMDVVRRNITALRGSIEIDSAMGRGTTMRVRLPLTLAIIDGFLVGVGDSNFVVPLDMVVECVELSPEEIAAAQGRDHLNLRGELLPFIRLKQLFELNENSNVFGPENSTRALAETPLGFDATNRENVVVVQYAGHRAGLVVESLHGEFQTVIRPLGVVFSSLQGISGFTILGSGEVALILDVPGLVRRVASQEARTNARASVFVPAN